MQKINNILSKNCHYLLYLYALSSALSISASTVILLIFLSIYLLNIKENYKSAPKDFLLFAAYYIWAMFTLLFNGIFSKFSRIINIWDKLPYIFASNMNIDKNKIINFLHILFLINSIVIIYALLQKFLGAPIIVKSLYTPDMIRFKGFFSHPLRFAGYISLISLFAFNFAVFYSNKFIAYLPFLILSVFLTGSRSYFISFIATTLLLSYIKSKKLFSIYSISILLYITFVFFVFPDVRGRTESSFDSHAQGVSSASLRFNFWKAGLEIFKSSPIYGVGFYEVSNRLKPYMDKGLIDNNAHCHNSYITASAETGFIGLIIYISIFLYFMRKYLLIGYKEDNLFIKSFSYSLFSAFLNLAIAGIFESQFSTFIIWSFLTLSMGLFEKINKTKELAI